MALKSMYPSRKRSSIATAKCYSESYIDVTTHNPRNCLVSAAILGGKC